MTAEASRRPRVISRLLLEPIGDSLNTDSSTIRVPQDELARSWRTPRTNQLGIGAGVRLRPRRRFDRKVARLELFPTREGST